MKLIIVSGRSGSGKSTALHVLEDMGYYCIDNLPIGLLSPLTQEVLDQGKTQNQQLAVSIDARNLYRDLSDFPSIYATLQAHNIDVEIIYLDANDATLIKRFHATRRKHPLSSKSTSLKEAIAKEKQLLEPIATLANLYIDTSDLSIYQLRDQVKIRVIGHKTQELALLFQSFGFKHGVPSDSDMVFDVRCLPNPYWDTALRGYKGTDQEIIEFLKQHPEPEQMLQHIISFLETWIPHFQNSNRTYMTISIGCTGGQHRSVYICECLGEHFKKKYDNVQVRHKELAQ
ncbi:MULTISPECIES: RNase adapter RapZ [unclassified Hahella]|uniref:RNase adapter RapZ n=1 Tax=unclassified Hahella TaxID=2624107 RepID=UPI000FDDFC1F|nr:MULTISPECIES: RNase adapter RapZ [unclassified Hahella]AZZ90852.1 RNase adapter RapZ [Hahella sp. KA22]MBU6949998.1 RNase adapter RapZ [Hahella sp. HN01]MDG9668209.1 RNase adapter RapZ [Hahella sp. CR1]QAY54222.1 RNase adapter RapZ [Hahella sp. KA22]WLQ14583.1 RNase adapter RapZ [Hahella sp. HNIBRBA332]